MMRLLCIVILFFLFGGNGMLFLLMIVIWVSSVGWLIDVRCLLVILVGGMNVMICGVLVWLNDV